MITFVASALVRALVVSSLALVAVTLLRRAPARVRRSVLAVGFAVALLGPALSSLVPLAVVPAPVVARARAPFVEPLEGGAPVPVLAPSTGRTRERMLAAWEPSAHEVLFGVWALVASALLVRAVVSRLRAGRLGSKGVELADGVVVTSDVDGPVVVGALGARILLPPAALEWDEERLGVVLGHERAHVAAHDGLARLVADVACAVYWPVPSVWVAAARLARESELAADEAVVDGGVASTIVAEHLVAVAHEARIPAPRVAFGMASELGRRVSALLDARPARWSRGRSRGAFGVVAVAIAVVGCAGESRRVALPAATSAGPVGAAPAAPAAVAKADDPTLTKIVDEERARAISEYGAAGAVVLVMDAKTHGIVATSGDVDTMRVPGSTVKPLVYATALDVGAIQPDSTFDCGNGRRVYGDKVLEDASAHGMLPLATMLAVSSNVGASRVADKLGRDRTLAALRGVGLGEGVPTTVDEGYGLAVLAAGEGLHATPRALLRAYGALVDGTLDGKVVFRRETADTMRLLLEEVVYGKEGTGARAAVDGARISGKTGTSEDGRALYASFVGFVPSREPRWVVYVGIDAPKDRGYAGKTAAPAFARIVTRMLAR
ncbi:MAG: penicillin-binding transpeptidase domain-containing protein [Polyangiaceae bacterium]